MNSIIGSPGQGRKNKWNNALTANNGLPASRKASNPSQVGNPITPDTSSINVTPRIAN